ncbi:MAG: SBBP repeat-containing protein [Ignavibacteria bacterium]|nr:SBBP repeat-containing protein [Ignavibacteria bacterium]
MKKITAYLFYLIFLFASGQESPAQISQEWAVLYNGPGNGNDIPYSIITDISNDIIVTGTSGGIGTGNDILTIKYNSSGEQQWIQRYNGTGKGYDASLALTMDDIGNVYVTGSSEGIGTGFDIVTIKYNLSGDQQWIQRYNGPSDSSDTGTSLDLDASGNIYVLGESKGIGTGSDVVLIKYNSSGAEQWAARYNSGGDTNDYSLKVIVDKNQDICVAAYNINSGGNNTKYVTLKFNSNGILQWSRIYNGPVGYFNTPHDFALDSADNIYVTGCSPGIGTGLYDFCTIKYNPAGDMIWLRRYNYLATAYDVANAIVIGASGNVYISGYSGSTSLSNTFDYATVKYDSSGNELWVRRYNGTGNNIDRARFVKLDSMENVYVTGSSVGSGTGTDYVTLKYDSSGQQLWTARYDGPVNGDDFPTGVSVTGSGLVFLTGYSQGSGSGFDYATIKYSQKIGVTSISSEIPESFSLYQNYPNPFNPSTNIKFSIPKSIYVSLTVFDILGREIATLVNRHLQMGNYEADWNAGNYPGGIYFYTLSSGEFSETRKMTLIK